MDTAHEPNPYGYAGEDTVPESGADGRRRDDELEDTAESIAIPADDLTTPFEEAAGEMDDKR